MSELSHAGQVGEWRSAEELGKELLPGDLVEMDRMGGKFQHWAVCLQTDGGRAIIIDVNGDVATGLGAVLHTRDTVADIRVEALVDAVGKDPVRYNNSIDERFEPYTSGEIVRRGLSKVGQHDYSVWNNNCEHWACWCRNGHHVSAQQEVAAKELDAKKEEHQSRMAHLKEKADAKVAELKEKLSRPPPKPEALDVKLSDDVLQKFPFLKRFEGKTTDKTPE